MIYGNSKRIVVVRDIPSNVIEEAILILKHEPEGDSSRQANVKNPKKEAAKLNTDYLLKEAESIINSYINENKLQEKYPRKVNLGKKLLPKNKKLSNILINLGLVISIALLIFVLSRFM